MCRVGKWRNYSSVALLLSYYKLPMGQPPWSFDLGLSRLALVF